MCSKYYIFNGVNDLSVTHPDVFAQIHSEMNNIDISRLHAGMDKKLWWKCNENNSHYWPATPKYRIQSNSGCGMCNNSYIVFGINDISVTHSALYRELHATLNLINKLDTTKLSSGSSKKVWWQCKENPSHYWCSTVKDRTQNHGCGMCHNLYVISGINDLSVSDPTLYSRLHRQMNEDQGVNIENLSYSTARKVWWKCSNNASHYWPAKVNTLQNNLRSSSEGSANHGCGMCRNFYVVHGVNDLSVTHPHLYNQIHTLKNQEYGIDTTKLVYGTDRKIWWKCDKNSSHYWLAKVSGRSIGRNCGMCASSFVVEGINDLSTTHPEIYQKLHLLKNSEANYNVTNLTGGSDKKVWWQCEYEPDHSWLAPSKDRVRGQGCPHCIVSKTEREFRELFSNLTGEEFVSTKIVAHRLNSIRPTIQIDMLNETFKVAIEYDGYWSHGGNKLHRRTEAQGLEKDEVTTEAIIKAGYTVLRIRETPLLNLSIGSSNFFQIPYDAGSDKRMIVEACLKLLGLKNKSH